MFKIQQKDANKKSIIAMALITAVSLFGDSMLYVVLPIYWQEIGLTSLVQVGILLSVNRFIRLPLNPLIGWLYKKISIRSGVFLAVLIAGLTTFLYGWVHDFYIWLILRCIWGLAWSFFRLGSYFMILDLSSDHNRGYFIGTYNGLSKIGSLIGMLAGSLCVEWFGLRAVATVFGIMAFMILPAVLMFLPKNKNRMNTEENVITKRAVLKLPALPWILISAFLVVMCLDGMLTATLSHLIDVHQKTSVLLIEISIGAATIAGVLQATRLILSSFLSPWVGKLSDGRWGRRPFLVGALSLAAVFMALVNFNLPFSIWLLDLFAVLLVSSILVTLMDALVLDFGSGAIRKVTMTLYVIVTDVGASIGPVFGYLSEQIFGLHFTYWVSAVILLLLSIAWFMKTGMEMRKNNKRNFAT